MTQTIRLIGLFLVGLFSGVLIGFTTGVIAGALLFLKEAFLLVPWQEGLLVSIVLMGGFIGALGAPLLVHPLGQKKTLLCIAFLFFVTALSAAYSPSFIFLLITRFIAGLAVGLVTVVGPMYISEMAPSAWRGFFVSSVQLAITIGILMAYLINTAYAYTRNWPMMFTIGTIPALLLFFTMTLQPDAPQSPVVKKTTSPRWRSLKIGVRQAMIFACVLFLFQNLSGIDAVLYYAPSIFRDAGFLKPGANLHLTVLLGCVNVLATILSMGLLDKIGRRPVLLCGLFIMSLSLAGFGAFVSLEHSISLPMMGMPLLLTVFIIAFAMSLGPIPYILMTELFPLRLRVIGIGVASATGWGINGVVTFLYPILLNKIGLSTIFYGFAFICVIAFIFAWFYCPETKKLSLKHIEAQLNDGRPLRQLGH